MSPLIHSPASKLCSHCVVEAPRVFIDHQVSQRFPYHQLISNAQGDCELCGFIATNILSHLGTPPAGAEVEYETNSRFTLRAGRSVAITSDEPASVGKLSARIIRRVDSDGGHDGRNALDGQDEHLDMPLKQEAEAKYIALGTDGERGAVLVKKWLQMCLNTHEKCSVKNAMPLPGRVLDVRGFPHSVVLRDSISMAPAPYTALSYSWGGEQPQMLLKARLEEYQKEIKVARLPETILQAVELTQAIGVDFLWVDSMCIIQDSEADKRKQLANMSHIYTDAILTIGVMAGSVREGFLSYTHNRSWLKLVLPHPTGTGTVAFDLHEDKTTALREPAEHRAWTLEERILASRLVTFSTQYNDMAWTCRERNYTNMNNHWAGVMRPGCPTLPRSIFESDQTAEMSRQDSEMLWSSWTSFVSEYCERTLTHPRDKLRAFGGLADQYQRWLGPNYFAGIWQQRLLEGLAWFCYAPDSRYPSFYRAPSWSWASLDGRVMLESHMFHQIEPLCDVLSISTTLEHQTLAFGSVTAGRLEIRGRVSPATISQVVLKDRPPGYAIGQGEPRVVANRPVPDFRPDTQEATLSSHAWCLALYSIKVRSDAPRFFQERDEDHMNLQGLALQLVTEGNTSTFRRIGYFSASMAESAWLLDAADRELTVV